MRPARTAHRQRRLHVEFYHALGSRLPSMVDTEIGSLLYDNMCTTCARHRLSSAIQAWRLPAAVMAVPFFSLFSNDSGQAGCPDLVRVVSACASTSTMVLTTNQELHLPNGN